MRPSLPICLALCASLFLVGCDRVGELVRPGSTVELTIPPPPPARNAEPALVVIDGDAVIVEMDDAIQCLGSSGAALASNGWSGTLSECPYAYFYEVELAAGTLPVRELLEPVVARLIVAEDEAPFRPLVRVTITDSIGFQHVFQTIAGF